MLSIDNLIDELLSGDQSEFFGEIEDYLSNSEGFLKFAQKVAESDEDQKFYYFIKQLWLVD